MKTIFYYRNLKEDTIPNLMAVFVFSCKNLKRSLFCYDNCSTYYNITACTRKLCSIWMWFELQKAYANLLFIRILKWKIEFWWFSVLSWCLAWCRSWLANICMWIRNLICEWEIWYLCASQKSNSVNLVKNLNFCGLGKGFFPHRYIRLQGCRFLCNRSII